MDICHRIVLQNSFLFHDISNEDSINLIKCLSPHIKNFTKNEIILFTGDSVHHIGIILIGTACAYIEHNDGTQTLISNLTPMSVFGEVLVSTRTHKSPVTVYATSDVTTTFIKYQKLHSMCTVACAAHRMLLQNLLKSIGDKYFSLFDRINILREKSLRSRIMAYLFTMSGRGADNIVTIPYTKTMLADYLLVNRSALSKELSKMERDNIIIVNGREIKILKLN